MADAIPLAAPKAESIPAGLFLSIVAQLCVQLVVGLILSYSYSPNILTAHASDVYLHAGSERLLQALHYWGSALLILESLISLVVLGWLGRFRGVDRWMIWGALLAVVTSFGFQATGNVLPMDQHGVETVVVETGIMARLPVLGPKLQKVGLDGPQFGQGTLHLWYTAHCALVAAAAAFLFCAIMAYRAGLLSNSSRVISAILALAPFALAWKVASPLGTPATSMNFTEFGAMVSWYTWPLHGALRMFDDLNPNWGWVGAMLIPGLALLFFLLLPWIGPRIRVNGARVGIAIILCFFGVAAFKFGGTFAPLTGTRDPAEAVAKGPVAPFNQAAEARGLKLIQKEGCSDCHGVNLRGASGPSLQKEGLRHSDAAFFEKYVRNPTSVDPESTMSPFPDLSPSQLADIAEYLRSRR